MAEEVISSLNKMRLTTAEEDIVISDEGRADDIESCILSLIGKFLTCKAYNKQAAKNTIRRAWGLEKDLQIVEVGENLFQFKFQTEFVMERVLSGGPWSFDNQLLMLRKWQRGMCAGNVSFEHASLWVQIWGAPFEMLSLKVAAEIGGRLGQVEEVESRKQRDDQSLFLRVRVAIPIAKPLRRGGFLVGTRGERTWATFKYERLPMLCHYCGLLGHDLRHCAAHYEAKKLGEDINYQYGDWLRATSNRQRSSPRRRDPMSYASNTNASPMARGDGMMKNAVAPPEKGDVTEAEVSQENPHESQSVKNGSLANIPKNPDVTSTSMEVQDVQEVHPPNPVNHEVTDTTRLETNGPMLAISKSGPGHSKELKQVDRPSGTWTKVKRVDGGLTYPLSVELGKRSSTWREEELNLCDIEVRSSKREKQTLCDGLDIKCGSAGVGGHLCRDQ